MKKWLSLILALLLVFSGATASYGAEGDIQIKLGGASVMVDVAPVNVNGSVLVSLKTIQTIYGAQTSYDDKSKTITLSKQSDMKIVFKIDSLTAQLNGKEVSITSPAKIIGNTPMVPIGFIAKSFGSNISWDGKTKSVNINFDNVLKNESSTGTESLDKKITDTENKVKKAEEAFGELVKDNQPYRIIGEIYYTGVDYIIIKGSAIGNGIGFGSGYIKVKNPDESKKYLDNYTGIHFYLKTELDKTLGSIKVFDGGNEELHTAYDAIIKAQSELDSLREERVVLVEKLSGIKEINYDNGDYYKGTLDNSGNQDGKGKYIWSNGDVYDGEWVNGSRTGNGKYDFSNGDLYEGGFKNGQFHGYGVLKTGYHPEGTLLGSYVPSYFNRSYTGEFEDGVFHGTGTFVYRPNPLDYASGEEFPYKYSGDFYKGEFQGQGILTDIDGLILFEGTWEKGVPLKNEPEEQAEPKKWYDYEYTEKISDTYGKYTNGGVEYTAIYPLAWGEPDVEKRFESLIDETTFYNDGKIVITAEAEYYNEAEKEAFLDYRDFSPQYFDRIPLKSGYEAYYHMVKTSSGVSTIRYIVLGEGKSVFFRMTIYDTHTDYWENLADQLDDLVNSLELIPGMG